MLFSATVFVFLFLPLVLLGHWLLPPRGRNAWLLAASLFFYGWGEPAVLGVMVASIAVNWGVARFMADRLGSPAARRALGVGLVFNVAVLAHFKYRNFIGVNIDRLADWWGFDRLNLDETLLPVGISFFTFQAMSYLIDVARGHCGVEKKPIAFAMYIALFPQLVAGPIVRYRDIAAEIVDRRVDTARFAIGVRRFIIGLGKKMLIANQVAVVADDVFGLAPNELSTAAAWIGLLAYSAQIYFDFSGYSDMAIGLGAMLGFTFPENFRYPYVATSVTEFWRRWHISLSTWFRDYLYIPLGGNRRGARRTLFNLVIVFALCGLWHGAQWTFVIWGLWHGAFLVLERRLGSDRLHRLPVALQHAYTLFVVCLGWVLFRASSLPAAIEYISALFGAAAEQPLPWRAHAPNAAIVAFFAAVLGSKPWSKLIRHRNRSARDVGIAVARDILLVGIFYLSVAELAAATHNPFIYFRF